MLTALNEELEGLQKDFFQASEFAKKVSQSVLDKLFFKRPEPHRWSMSECFDHLNEVGHRVLEKIDLAIEKGHQKKIYSEGPFKYSRLGNWFIQTVGPENYRENSRIKSPKIYQPLALKEKDQVIPSFIALQDHLIARLEKSEDLDLARIRIASPVSPLIRMSLGQWFHLISEHQKRHFIQINNIKKQLMHQ